MTDILLIEPLEEFIIYASGYKYQLKKTVRFRIPSLEVFKEHHSEYISILDGGILKITKGYAWNGASGPTVDTKSSMRASLVHDALFQLETYGILPLTYTHTANAILEAMCLLDGMIEYRANAWRVGVDWFGTLYARPSNQVRWEYAP